MGKEFWCRLSPAVPLTSYIRFALHHKCVSVCMVSAETPILKPDMLVLQCGSDTFSGSGETLMRYIESRFPRSSLVMSRGDDWDETSWPDSGQSANGGEEVWEELWSSSGGDTRDGIRPFFFSQVMPEMEEDLFFFTCGGWPGRKKRAYWTLKNSSAKSAWTLYYFWD